MDAVEFKQYIEKSIERLAELYGMSKPDLEKYYTLTDYQFESIRGLSGINLVFAQYAFHAQNSQRIDKIVKFMDNFDFIKEKTKNFNPSSFLEEYHFKTENDRNETVENIIKAFKYDEDTGKGLKWSEEKSEKRPGAMIKRYANALIDGAVYFKDFETKEDVIDDFEKHYQNEDFKELISYANGLFKHGFSVALCCDFLKELDPRFKLGKPDIHLKEVLAKYKGLHIGFYKKNGIKYDFKCLSDFLELVKEIQKTYPNITAYMLDRQIWLCCTGNFFLDDIEDIKQLFMKGIV